MSYSWQLSLHLKIYSFLILVAIVNRIVFLISSSDNSLLECRNVTKFVILSLYTISLVNSLATTVFIKYNLHGLFLYVKSFHLNMNSFIFCFFILDIYHSFSCFIALIKICSPSSPDSIVFRSMTGWTWPKGMSENNCSVYGS